MGSSGLVGLGEGGLRGERVRGVSDGELLAGREMVAGAEGAGELLVELPHPAAAAGPLVTVAAVSSS